MSQRLLLALIAVTALLPIAICVVAGVAGLLAGMGDSVGAGVLNRVALAIGLLWIVDLISLLLVLAVANLRGPDQPKDP